MDGDDDDVHLNREPHPRAPVRAAPALPAPLKPKRDKQVERAAQDILTTATGSLVDEDGAVDGKKVVVALKRALAQLDPSFRADTEAGSIVRVMKAALALQDKSAVSMGVNRAIADQMGRAVADGVVSGRAVESLLGVSRKRLRDVPDNVSVPKSFSRARNTRSDASGPMVEASVREFAYCHSKYTEKTYVCLLAKRQLYHSYCVYHDKEGRYYPQGSFLLT